jgi:hypothetical protein
MNNEKETINKEEAAATLKSVASFIWKFSTKFTIHFTHFRIHSIFPIV